MTRILVTIRGDADRERIAELAKTLAVGVRVEIKQEKRSPEQNAKLWACLGDVAEQVKWHGISLDSEDWKLIFMNALKREVRIVPNLDGTGFVSLGQSSSDLSVAEMSDLIELVLMFGANHGVTFSDPKEQDSSDGIQAVDRTDAPAADPPVAAGAILMEEVSLLSPDWRDVYLAQMTGPATRASSIQTRDHNALQMMGGAPNAAEREWMRRVATLTNRRDKGKLKAAEFETELTRLKSISLAKLTRDSRASCADAA